MPTATYEELLLEALPARIESDEEYEQIGERFGELLGAKGRTPEETRLLNLLAVLVEDYDRRNAMPPDESTPGERLRFLMEHSGRSPSDLLAIFGQRSHVNEALNGKRRINLEHARKLGELFSVQPGLFV